MGALVAARAVLAGCTQDPCYAPPLFDCPVRQLALDYANATLRAGADLASVAAALNLSACSAQPLAALPPRIRAVARRDGDAEATIVVSPKGDDKSGDGSLAHPFATIHRAQIAARAAGAGSTVSIRAGMYYLSSALVLTELDSGTSYVNYVGERPVLSGGEPLAGLKWTKWAASAWVATLPAGTAPIDSLFLTTPAGGNVRQWQSRWPNGNPALPSDGYSTEGTPVHAKKPPPMVALPMNVNVYCVQPGTTTPQLVATGTMPNNSFAPTNFTVPCSTINGGTTPGTSSGTYGPDDSQKTYAGGALKRFTPAVSFWESSVPTGMTLQRARSWTKPAQWKVHGYHPELWGNWGFQVASYENETGTMAFGVQGGHQEARGGEGMGPRYFEGMLEELDSSNEFHHDADANLLYWVPPTSNGGGAPPTEGLVAPRLKQLIEVIGSSAESPAANVRISGLTLRHSSATFCCDHPYESVSGGDWSLHRGGAVFLENATDVTVSDCLLDAPEGNGIVLNGYSERVTVEDSEVRSSGDSSIVMVGIARYMDGRAKSYPVNNTIARNHLHDWGVWGKQTSAYFGGIAREITVVGNVIYNGPRAGINQNDGFGGGHIFAQNLIFNTVLDTGDHGNFNSWDRKPWIWLEDQSDPTSLRMVPKVTKIEHNFIIRTAFTGPSANLYCIDHDDGSSMYNDTSNFLVYGGIKFRDGLSKHASGNFMAYPNGPDARQVPFADQCRGTNNSFTANTVVSHSGQFYGACAHYKTDDPSDHASIDGNAYYSAASAFDAGSCGVAEGTSWADWQRSGLGQDTHSTLRDSKDITYSAMLDEGMKRFVWP